MNSFFRSIFQFHSSNYSMMVIFLFWQVFLSLSCIFVICELGQRVTNGFEDVGYTIEQLNWHLFPFKLWQTLPIFIIASQQPVRFDIFGSISCSRDDFKSVRKTEWNKNCSSVEYINIINILIIY